MKGGIVILFLAINSPPNAVGLSSTNVPEMIEVTHVSGFDRNLAINRVFSIGVCSAGSLFRSGDPSAAKG